MSQQASVCRNKVHAELKEEKELCHDKKILCRDIAVEVCEEDCCDTLNSVLTVIKANGSGTFLRKSLLFCNINE